MMKEFFTITKIKPEGRGIAEDVVAEEVPFTLIVDGKELVTILCSPLNLEDLARGFIYTCGLIKKNEQISKILLDRQCWKAYVELKDGSFKDLLYKRLYTSGCGKGTLFYNAFDIMYRTKINSTFSIKVSYISRLMEEFRRRSKVYLSTGGVHSAAVADKKDILAFREDIGRHSAIDKVIGYILLASIPFDNKILLTSGRISSEVIFKARRCNIPIVISKSAPTNQAVRHARDMDITLIGFARGSRMNIYSAPERIV
jgi:FdhD protein